MKLTMLLGTLLVGLGVANGGLLFKSGFIKGALKSLVKNSNSNDNKQCEVKWEEVWKPQCNTHYERVSFFVDPFVKT